MSNCMHCQILFVVADWISLFFCTLIHSFISGVDSDILKWIYFINRDFWVLRQDPAMTFVRNKTERKRFIIDCQLWHWRLLVWRPSIPPMTIKLSKCEICYGVFCEFKMWQMESSTKWPIFQRKMKEKICILIAVSLRLVFRGPNENMSS